jgi:hypothetical protein
MSEDMIEFMYSIYVILDMHGAETPFPKIRGKLAESVRSVSAKIY